MAVRQHLYALEREKLVTAEERPSPVGRPAKYWRLTPEADRLFPDAYAELSVALIGAMGDTSGPAGLEQVLTSRYTKQRSQYAERIPPSWGLAEKIRKLARVCTEEGYMADGLPGFLRNGAGLLYRKSGMFSTSGGSGRACRNA